MASLNKEVKVIMLPTEKATHIIYCNVHKQLHYWVEETEPISIKSEIGQHLYLVSDEEIKEGDWFVSLKIKGIYKANPENVKTLSNYKVEYIHKIIATTDKSLGLPLVNHDFIEAYVKAEGNINEVMVEYEYGRAYIGQPFLDLIPTLDNNTIIIVKK